MRLPLDLQVQRSQADDKASTQVIVVCHGHSTYNDEGRYPGSSDESGLTDEGCQAALHMGHALRGVAIDAIYTSPLQQAQQTVRYMLTSLGPTQAARMIHITPQLREINLPMWQGLSHQEVQERYWADYQCWKQRPHEFCMESVTPPSKGTVTTATATLDKTTYFPVVDLYDRATQFWQTVLPRHLGQTLLVVSHGSTNQALISTALGLSAQHHHRLQQCDGSINILRFPMGVLQSGQLEALNVTTHLGTSLPNSQAGQQGVRLMLVSAEQTTVEQAQALGALLKSVPISFSLTSDLDHSQILINEILRDRSGVLQLQVLRQDFPKAWQSTLQAQQTRPAELMTALVVAPQAVVRQILAEAIALNQEDHWRLPLQAGQLSVIHYPAADHPPVLQALNLSPEA
jgi:broad specificity phosphatase PhoE